MKFFYLPSYHLLRFLISSFGSAFSSYFPSGTAAFRLLIFWNLNVFGIPILFDRLLCLVIRSSLWLFHLSCTYALDVGPVDFYHFVFHAWNASHLSSLGSAEP